MTDDDKTRPKAPDSAHTEVKPLAARTSDDPGRAGRFRTAPPVSAEEDEFDEMVNDLPV